MMTRGRRRSPAAASPLENDDILTEIVIRLPPSPSSLPRASLVCKRWRRLISDPVFLRRFRARHRRNAPLLGFFSHAWSEPSFTPTMDPPNSIPAGRFSLELDEGSEILCCRHGLVLILNQKQLHVLVWDPVAGEVRRVALPPEFSDGGRAIVTHGAVLRATRDVPDWDDHSIPFIVVLVANGEGEGASVCVYSSVTGLWGDIISTACPSMIPMPISSALVGGSLYWMLSKDRGRSGILEFDMDKQCLGVIDVPPGILFYYHCHHWIMRTECSSLGFLCVSGYTAQLWMRKTGYDGVARWVPGRTIELDKLLSLDTVMGFAPLILGFAEEGNVSFLATSDGLFIVQLESMQFKKLFKLSALGVHHSFASVYTRGLRIADWCEGPDLMDNV